MIMTVVSQDCVWSRVVTWFPDCRDVRSIVKWQCREHACIPGELRTHAGELCKHAGSLARNICPCTQVNCASMQGHWLAACLTSQPIAMTSNVQISRRLVIMNDNLKQPWMPESKSVDGMDFICCHKWDRTLSRFATGVAIDLRKFKRNDVLNQSFMEELANRRTLAADEAIRLAFSTADSPAKPKHGRPRKAKSKDQHMVPPILSLDLPAIDGAESLVMRVLFGVKNEAVWVEASDVNLEYIKVGICSTFDKEGLGRRWKKAKPAKDEVDTQATSADSVVGDKDEEEEEEGEGGDKDDE
jgi:hypothetical protein